MASLIGHFTFVFLLRRPCLSVFCTIYQFMQRAGVPRRSLWNCVRRELQAASGLLVLAFSDLSLRGREQEVLEESRREPKFASERRSPQHGTSQRSGEWVRATRRARRAAQDHPAELACLWNSVGLGVNTDLTRSQVEQASVKATTPHTYRQHYAEWMRWCRQSQKNLSTPTSLEMAMIQYFDHLFFKGSPSGIRRTVLVSVPLPPRLGPVSSKRRGPNQKGPEGLGTPCARELEGPAAVDPRARPRIGPQPARLVRDVNGDVCGFRCVSTSRRDRVAEKKRFGSATPGSGGPCTCSLAREGLRAKPSSTTTQLYWTRQAARGWDRWST